MKNLLRKKSFLFALMLLMGSSAFAQSILVKIEPPRSREGYDLGFYKVYYQMANSGDAWEIVSVVPERNLLGYKTTECILTGLLPNTVYAIRVRAESSDGYGNVVEGSLGEEVFVRTPVIDPNEGGSSGDNIVEVSVRCGNMPPNLKSLSLARATWQIPEKQMICRKEDCVSCNYLNC